MAAKTKQQCLRQGNDGSGTPIIDQNCPIPTITKPYQVLVHVAAVALNPFDHKSPSFCPTPGAIMGFDFTGTIVTRGGDVRRDLTEGTRVCGAVHGSNPSNPQTGAFAEYVVADSRLLLKPPAAWTHAQAAALGGAGWLTAGLVLYDYLKLDGRPSAPATNGTANGDKKPVLVYGAATATGTMICQILTLSGYAPVAICSTKSSAMVSSYGAVTTIDYTSLTTAAETIKTHTRNQLRLAIDCIATPESLRCCMAAIGRAGGDYIAIEHTMQEWHTRRAVHVHPTPLAYEVWGEAVTMGPPYDRDASPAKLESAIRWTEEMQRLVEQGMVRPHPPKALEPGFQQILDGLKILEAGKVSGEKLVVCLGSKCS
ncbi:alcohol dehydrogenase GroES-like domain-containing protein [Periconia macrospinosa]|uniref:Alcohol dehydrogenase GroES-like domain-containing protein n=1 Tax=Periconia macrospinosa TaxID=97972 RepID=A0A2V1DA57_9PLEO|nr:alcohol dehydrogenase GroES-like domain-containing protein [Periconia macrospinosa]